MSPSKLSAAFLALVLSAGMAFAANSAPDSVIQASIAGKLQSKPEFSNVQSSVADGVVTLKGTVDGYKAKFDAEKQARKAGHVRSVQNQIVVAGPSLPDNELREKLARDLRYDRVGYGNVFNVLTVGVKDGVVTLGGEVRTPVDRDSAFSVVENTRGVKDVVNEVKVAPVSNFDDSIRLRTLRAVYGDPVLSKYALDPQQPIRILVDNGHVGLYGTVNSAMDKQIAGIRANQVFGAFSVENHLNTATTANR
ncbi:MAG TPA: BON domain-containing protein [Terriglobales bacterium]|nr:BON domain-containing protein [Terriglobales bacterium]